MFGVVLLALYLGRTISNWLKQRKEADLANLRTYHQRLTVLISELLAKANDLDQHQLYVFSAGNPQFSNNLASICQELVVLTDSLPVIGGILADGHVGQSRQDLLASVKTAAFINRRLDTMRHELHVLTIEQASVGSSVSLPMPKKQPENI